MEDYSVYLSTLDKRREISTNFQTNKEANKGCALYCQIQ